MLIFLKACKPVANNLAEAQSVAQAMTLEKGIISMELFLRVSNTANAFIAIVRNFEDIFPL